MNWRFALRASICTLGVIAGIALGLIVVGLFGSGHLGWGAVGAVLLSTYTGVLLAFMKSRVLRP